MFFPGLIFACTHSQWKCVCFLIKELARMFFMCYFILQDSSDNTSLGNNSSDSSKLLILLSIPTSISHSTKCPSNSHPFDFKFFIGKKRKKKQHISLFIILEKFIKKSSNCEGHTEFKLPEKYQITYTTNYIFQVFEQCAVYKQLANVPQKHSNT